MALTGKDFDEANPAAIQDQVPLDSGKLAGRKVLFVINSDAGGGVEKMVGILSNALTQHGAQVNTHCLYERAGLSRMAKLKGALATPMAIVKARPDILITFQPTSSVLATVSAAALAISPRVVHQSNRPEATYWLSRLLDRIVGSLGAYSVIIANSSSTEKAFADYPTGYKKRLRRIVHGVDYTPPTASRDQTRLKFDISQDRQVILTCARLSPQKSLETVIAAMPGIPEAQFVIAGDGPRRSELEKQANEAGVAQRVRFLGHVNPTELPNLYAASDLFAFPSVWETFGLAAVEAAIQGLPVVASALPVSREVMETGSVDSPAEFVESWEPDDWATAINKALKDRSFKDRAQRAAPLIREKYSEEEMLGQYWRLFDELLD